MLRYILILLPCIVTIYGGPGTTPNIEQIFLGRCNEYQELPSGRLTANTTQNCTELWTSFKNSWAFKNPWKVTAKDYQTFLRLAKIGTVPADQSLLWSGTFDIAHEYSYGGRRYVTLEDSLVGYTVSGLTWCGIECTNCSGINYNACPDWSVLPENVSQAFWGGLSQKFAESAIGDVRLMLTGSNPNRKAYLRTSYFAKFELQALRRDVRLVVILANDIDKVPLEHCGTGSLLDLKADVDAKGIRYICLENPSDILHLMCVDNTASAKCNIVNRKARHRSSIIG